ncbi:hypothetical protein [Algoriphagus sp.]|uniref:hypothetical protein n=1 Tax=Algoriphagus sp. TaxID=1872435 RepID=UPI0025ECBB18|nr:hypothetical protein [Algoriphagus sp.]
MPLITLTTRTSFEENPKLAKPASKLRSLLASIEEKEIPVSIEGKINEIITGANDFPGPDPLLIKQIKVAQTSILKLLEKELSIFPKNHFQQQWMILGMTVFGLPMGVVFGMSLGNLAFLGIGLPIGMAIGIAVGNSKDKEVEKEGRQLDWEST